MKKYLGLFLWLLPLSASAQFDFAMEIDVSSALEGKTIFLKISDYYSESRFEFVDSFIVKSGKVNYRGQLTKPVENAEFFTVKDDYYVSFYIDSGMNRFRLNEPDKRLYKRLRITDNRSISSRLHDSLTALWERKQVAEKDLRGDDRIVKSKEFNRDALELLRQFGESFASLIELYRYSYRFLGFSIDVLIDAFGYLGSDIQKSDLGLELAKRLQRIKLTGIGNAMPEIIGRVEGERFTNKSLEGTVYLVAFGAPWCLPCKENLAVLKGIFRNASAKGFKILMINLDDDYESWEKEIEEVEQEWIFFNENRKFQESELAKQFSISAIPQYLIVDKEGMIRYNFLNSGAKLDAKSLEAFVLRLLDAK